MSITEETHIPVWTLGERLTKAREHAGITIPDMARRLGVSDKTIRNWENQAVRITRATLIAYASETSVPIDWIVGDDLRSRCSFAFDEWQLELFPIAA